MTSITLDKPLPRLILFNNSLQVTSAFRSSETNTKEADVLTAKEAARA